jgi:nitrate reductase gamma subunit
MTTNDLLFGALPYAVFLLAIVVTIARWRLHPFSVSSLSSQLLESRKLYWGSIPFHWGISLILGGHLLALIVPGGFQLWNGSPLRLALLEITGLALALWAAFGITVLIVRRLGTRRIQVVTTPMDLVVLALIAVQILTGIWTAVAYRFGSSWGTSVMVPYIRSLIVFQPDTSYIEPMPVVVQAHVLAFFVFVAVFPFTRLVHIITLPISYLWRPWQRVVRNRPAPAEYHPAADRPLEKADR